MSSYNPPPDNRLLPAEEFELASLPTGTFPAGPSRLPLSPKRKKLMVHSNHSSPQLLFSASAAPRPARAVPMPSRQPSIPISPDIEIPRRMHRAQFLNEELDSFFTGEVSVPDFGHLLGVNPDAGDDHFVLAQGMKTRWKRKLYLLMEEPSSGREAFFVHVLVTGAILFSAVLTTLSTLPSFHTDPSSTRVLFGLDTAIVVLFTFEYLARSLAHSDSISQYYKWSTSFLSLLDLVAIFPYYVEVARNDDTSILFRFSILRTFRLLRVFRAFKYQNQMLLTIEVMYVAVQRSKDALVALSFFILLVLVFFSTLIYFAERGTWDPNLGGFVDADGDPSLFDSIPQTAWFALVTMSTVGYGDVVPRSSLGKVLTVPLLMFGLLLIALPSFVLGRNFAIVFDAMTKQALKPPSVNPSVRASLSRPNSPILTARPIVQLPMVESDTSTPLLPTFTADRTQPSIPSAPGRRSESPLPSSSAMVVNSSIGVRAAAGFPRMWDGSLGPDGNVDKAKERDLTNTKLAKNQLVLLEEIASLRRTADKQNEILRRLMAALDSRDLQNGHSREISQVRREDKDSESDEEQFALGGEDDEESDE